MDVPSTEDLNKAVRKAQIEAVVTVLEANGFQGAYTIAEQAVDAASAASKAAARLHLRELWTDLGDLALDTLDSIVRKNRP